MSDLSLDPKKTALVAIDLQNALMGRSTAPHPVAEVLKTNRQIAEALPACPGRACRLGARGPERNLESSGRSAFAFRRPADAPRAL